MTTEVTYSQIKDLSLLDKEDLLVSEEIVTLTKVLNTVGSDKTVVFTVEDITDHLISQDFYLPRLTAFGDKLGFFISGKFFETLCNFELGKPGQTTQDSDPIRYDIRIETADGDSVTTSLVAKPKSKMKALFEILDVLVVDGVNDHANIVKLIAMLEPSAVSVIPEGTYNVVSIKTSEKSSQLKLENGMLVTVNKACPGSITAIQSISSAIYMVSNGQIVRGISVTGMAQNLISGSDDDCKEGDVFEITAVSTNNAGKGDYSLAKLTKEGQSGSAWFNVEGNVGALALRKISRGQVAKIRVSGIRPKTGNMKNPKPVFTPA